MCQITSLFERMCTIFRAGFRKISSMNSAVVQWSTGVSQEFQWKLGYLFTHSTTALETQTQQL